MKLSSVRLFVCPVIEPPHATAAGLMLWARRPGDGAIVCRATGAQQHRRANVGSATLSANV